MNKNVPLFQIHDASVQRDGRTILHIDDLVLNDRESIAILGPNGSGKSTFIGLLTREVLPLYRDEPPVLFYGKPRTTLQEMKSNIGLVSSAKQSRVTRHIEAIKVVVGGLTGSLVNANATSKDDERAYAVMEELRIEGLADRDVTTLSSGEARRVLIARALINNPRIVIFDEPCTGLDPEGMYYVRKIMNDLISSGKNVILVTHYPEDIVSGINRVALLKNGLIEFDGLKAEALNSETISKLFDVPIHVHKDSDQYTITFA